MGEEPISTKYRARQVADGPATPVGQMDPAQWEAQFSDAVQALVTQLGITEDQARQMIQRGATSVSPGGPLPSLPSLSQELISQGNPVLEHVGPPLVPEVPPPILQRSVPWFKTLASEEQDLVERILTQASGGFYMVEAFADVGVAGAQGSSWLQLLTGEMVQVPIAINGQFGRFAIAPLVQPSAGNLPVDTADNVQLNVAGEVVITGGSVEITGTVDVAIQGTPSVTISGTPSVTISGNADVTIQNASISVANISYGGSSEVQFQSNAVLLHTAYQPVTGASYTVPSGFKWVLKRANFSLVSTSATGNVFFDVGRVYGSGPPNPVVPDFGIKFNVAVSLTTYPITAAYSNGISGAGIGGTLITLVAPIEYLSGDVVQIQASAPNATDFSIIWFLEFEQIPL